MSENPNKLYFNRPTNLTNTLEVSGDSYFETNIYVTSSVYISGDLDLDCGVIYNLSAIENNMTCVDLINVNTDFNFTTSGALVLPVGGAVTNTEVFAIDGAIRYNTAINSFEGFSNNTWTGLGGVINLHDTTGNTILGTAKAFRCDVEPSQNIGDTLGIKYGDLWFDTNNDVIKYYYGTNPNVYNTTLWKIFGAAYL